jgi:hypothetical protein
MKNILKMTLIMGLMFAMTNMSFAQETKTADELKAERQQLQTELKSKDVTKREDRLQKLYADPAKQTGVQSVDGLAKTSVGILQTVISTNDFLSEFKREVTDNGEGEIDVTVHKAKLEDYVKLAEKLIATNKLVVEGTEEVKNVQADVKSLKPLEATKATKSVKVSTETLQLSGEEIALQMKLVNNLIATIKSADNL